MEDQRQSAADVLADRVIDLLRGVVRRVRAEYVSSSPLWAQAVVGADLLAKNLERGGEVRVHVYVPRQELGSMARIKVEWTRHAIPVWWSKEVYVVGGTDDPDGASLASLHGTIFDVRQTVAKSIRLKYLHRKYPRRRRMLGQNEPKIALGGIA